MLQIRKAERRQAKLRLALCGVSGSGKTLGALFIAKGMGGKVAVIDTENKSADLYSDVMPYDVIDLGAPFTPERYMEAINICEQNKYDIVIIDSLSHAWAGEGGLLEMQDKITQASSSKNGYFAWRQVTPYHNKLVETILQSDMHIIATMRSKTQYEVLNDGQGKTKPVKIGLAPIQREGMDYEFTVVLDIDLESHLYTSSKDRTRLFDGKNYKINEKTGIDLMNWLNDGKSPEEEARELVDQINNTSTMDELKSIFSSALNTHKHIIKSEAFKVVIEAKDKKKAELTDLAA